MIAVLREGAVLWWSWIAPISIQAAVLIVFVGLIDRLLPRRTWPEARAALWLLTMIKLVLPPSLASPWSFAAWMPGWLPGGGEVLAGVSLDGATAVLEGGTSGLIFWAQFAVAIWAAGVALLALAGLVRYRRSWRYWTDDATREMPPGFSRHLEKAVASVGLRRPPRVLFSPSVRTPFVAGLLRPCVFLPLDLRQNPGQGPRDEGDEESVEHILLHELCHLKRFDTRLSALCTAIQLLYWFHPLVWLAQRRLAEVREQCCDSAVARILDGATEGYRRTLLRLAARLIDDPLAGRLRFIRPTNLLLARLRLLERSGARRHWLRRLVGTTIIAVSLVAFVPMARHAGGQAIAISELIDRPPGCLQLRYLVLHRLAEAERAGTIPEKPDLLEEKK